MPAKRNFKALRARLEEDLRTSSAAAGELDDEMAQLTADDEQEGGVPANHMADFGSNVYERERLMTIEQEMRDRATLIREALDRMDAGTYGTCERCGAQIPIERLEALPYTSVCVDCQAQIDAQAGEMGVKEQAPLQP